MQSNILSARFILRDLLDERSVIFKQLEELKSASSEDNNLEIKELEEEFQCRLAQIEDLQQQILDADGMDELQFHYILSINVKLKCALLVRDKCFFL